MIQIHIDPADFKWRDGYTPIKAIWSSSEMGGASVFIQMADGRIVQVGEYDGCCVSVYRSIEQYAHELEDAEAFIHWHPSEGNELRGWMSNRGGKVELELPGPIVPLEDPSCAAVSMFAEDARAR